jgi:hypothetical protein
MPVLINSGLLGFWALSIVWCSKKNTTFRKLNLFPSSSETRGAPTLLGRLETANLSQYLAPSNRPKRVAAPPSVYLMTETDPVSETLYF